MWNDLRSTALLLALLILPACGAPVEESRPTESDATPASEVDPASSAATAPAIDIPLVLFLGDSLSAGYGLSEEQAFPALVEGLLEERGIETRVVNAGVSGDTTAGGLARLEWLLRQEPDVVVVELGGNDGLRGFDPEVTQENLRQIIERSQAAGAEVLLAGLQLPPNYGSDYLRRFAAVYPKLAAEFSVPLIPFLLEGVGGDPDLNLPDGLHPNVEGQKIVARTVADYLDDLLR